jgi:hypothetical protein
METKKEETYMLTAQWQTITPTARFVYCALRTLSVYEPSLFGEIRKIKISLTTIARITGMEKATMSRACQELKSKKIIDYRKQPGEPSEFSIFDLL